MCPRKLAHDAGSERGLQVCQESMRPQLPHPASANTPNRGLTVSDPRLSERRGCMGHRVGWLGCRKKDQNKKIMGQVLKGECFESVCATWD